ncbi:hypothetical protein [Propioniciclava sinopodophylli]|uniref:hypothetical protein n=1 Tax=Propioniciclava sinopodophylli TaxID=1837344 RepID=UPI0019D67D74|nr:hypothetical protein [Propioniciclava sinopodophylli]
MEEPRQYRWQVQPRFFVILGLFIALLFALWGVGNLVVSGFQQLAQPKKLQLPRGGETIFPEYRLVGYSGYPGAEALGRLGTGDIDERMAEIEQVGADYVLDRKLMPVMELIAVTVHSQPGSDGLYRSRVKDEVVQSWLDTAREHKAMLLLNIQPGRAKFIDEVKHLEKWLVHPDVGLALDPEWAVGPDEVPGEKYGHSSGAELDEVATYVEQLVERHNLPEKVLLYHQLHANIIADEGDLMPHPGVVLIKSVDGIGTAMAKVGTWNNILKTTPEHIHMGFKLFYEEDARHGPLMSADEVLALEPEPEYILYE